MSRPVKATACKCGAATLTGLDADWAGIQVTVDRQPIDNLGEFLALAQGRTTYDLRKTTGYRSHGQSLEERNAHRIADRLWTRAPVHAEHRCGQPLPVAAPVEPVVAASHDVVFIEGAPF